MATLADILPKLAHWQTDEGRPYKGRLIDWEAHEADPTNIGCMCAQGQALHLIGGWDFARIRNTDQAVADAATAVLFGISRAHAVLLRNINDTAEGAPLIVLTHPEKVLGSQAQTVLAFWRHLDRMTAKDWDATWVAAWVAAGDAAWDAAWVAARVAARDAARDAAGVAAWASNEIQGARIMRERGQAFYFLPLFGFADPESVLAADGEVA